MQRSSRSRNDSFDDDEDGDVNDVSAIPAAVLVMVPFVALFDLQPSHTVVLQPLFYLLACFPFSH